MSEQEKTKGLAAKLCEVMAASGYVQKRGFNEKQRYNYATEADVLDTVRGELAKRGVFIFPSVVESSRHLLGKTANDRDMYITDVMVKWTFLDGDSGETHECLMPGCGTDTGDKGLYKAITGSSKYLFLKAFMLPTGDDPEVEDDHGAHVGNGNAKSPNVAAQSVADRKIEEYKAKKENGTPNNELIEFTPWKENSIAISGKGLGILASEMGGLDTFSIWDSRDKVRYFAKDDLTSILNKCYQFKIPTKVHSPAGQATPPVRANIPPMPSVPQSAARIIESTEVKSGIANKKDKNGNPKRVEWSLMNVKWGNEQFVCWDKKLWPLLAEGRGKSAILETVPSFDQKKNPEIHGIEKIGDTLYEVVNGETIAIAPDQDGEYGDPMQYEGTV